MVEEFSSKSQNKKMNLKAFMKVGLSSIKESFSADLFTKVA
jgi:hypothetical protein